MSAVAVAGSVCLGAMQAQVDVGAVRLTCHNESAGYFILNVHSVTGRSSTVVSVECVGGPGWLVGWLTMKICGTCEMVFLLIFVTRKLQAAGDSAQHAGSVVTSQAPGAGTTVCQHSSPKLCLTRTSQGNASTDVPTKAGDVLERVGSSHSSFNVKLALSCFKSAVQGARVRQKSSPEPQPHH